MTDDFPSIKQCIEYHDQFEMLDNIRAHSFMVARVAEALVTSLKRSGKSTGPLPDLDEVIVGALMHDIAKTKCIKEDCRHAEVGYQICLELGYPQLATIVDEHVVLKKFRSESYQKGIFSRKEIVFYADKRVRHDQIVSLAERLDYILARYSDQNPMKEQLIHQNFRQALDFEKYLFNFLDFPPENILNFLSHREFTPRR